MFSLLVRQDLTKSVGTLNSVGINTPVMRANSECVILISSTSLTLLSRQQEVSLRERMGSEFLQTDSGGLRESVKIFFGSPIHLRMCDIHIKWIKLPELVGLCRVWTLEMLFCAEWAKIRSTAQNLRQLRTLTAFDGFDGRKAAGSRI